MTSRQTGRRMAAMSATGRRRGGRRSAPRRASSARRAEESLPKPGQLAQLVICGCLFVLLVAVKLLLPGRMEQIGQVLSGAMERNMDVQAVFSALGRAFSGESGVGDAADEVYRAVFHPEAGETAGARETSAALLLPEEDGAMRHLKNGRTAAAETGGGPAGEAAEQLATEAGTEAAPEQAASLAYILYSDQNLPENVSMQQAILDFDYCVPVSGTVSSGFGYRDHPVEGEERFHYGLDLAADTGTEIHCFADGTVTAVGDSSSYGKYCVVSHAGGYSTLYAHCSRVTAVSGAEVHKGEKIAEVGETGVATGPHLHFELQQNGTYLNPVYYVA